MLHLYIAVYHLGVQCSLCFICTLLYIACMFIVVCVSFLYWWCLVSTAAPGTPVLLGVTRDAAQPAGSSSILPAGGSTGRLRLLVQPGPYGLLGETRLALCTPPLPCRPLPRPLLSPTCSCWNHRARGLLVQAGLCGPFGEMLLALCNPSPTHPYLESC